MNNYNFGKHNILFRCNSCGKERDVLMDFIPELSDGLRVGATKVKFDPNPDSIKCPRCDGPMHPTVYLPDMIGE